MTQDKTDVKTRSKQKAREDNKHGAGSGQRQKNGQDKLQSREQRRLRRQGKTNG